jgi:hypothetical protein
VSFFAIGGTSLKGIKLISRIYKETGVLIKVADLFSHTTIEQLAQLVESSKQKVKEDIVRAEEKGDYELTHSQKRLWVIDQKRSGQTAYNIVCAYKLAGDLHISSFKEALQTIVKRHESLRTVFRTIEGQPRQCISTAESFVYNLEVLDMRDTRTNTIDSIIHERIYHAFDLEIGPLFLGFCANASRAKTVFRNVRKHRTR